MTENDKGCHRGKNEDVKDEEKRHRSKDEAKEMPECKAEPECCIEFGQMVFGNSPSRGSVI